MSEENSTGSCPECKKPTGEGWEVCPHCCTVLPDLTDQLEKANTQTESALAQAPNKKAMALNTELGKTTEKINTLIRRAKKQLIQAKFSEVKKTIEDVCGLQEDNKSLSNIKEELVRTEAAYNKLLQEAIRARDVHDWQKLASKAKNMLDLCHESPKANSFLEKVLVLEKQALAKQEKREKRKKRKKQVVAIAIGISIIGLMIIVVIPFWAGWSNRQHLKAADDYLSSGNFDEARQELAECGWFLVTGKSKLAREIDDAQYNWLLQHVDYLSKNKQYDDAVKALNKASAIKNDHIKLKPLIDAMVERASLEKQRRRDEASIIKKGWVTSRGPANYIPWNDPPCNYVLTHETVGSSNDAKGDLSVVLLAERLPNRDLLFLNRSDGRFIRAKRGEGGFYCGRLEFDDAPLGTRQSIEMKSNNGRIYELCVMWTMLNRDNNGNLESAKFYYEIRRKQ